MLRKILSLPVFQIGVVSDPQAMVSITMYGMYCTSSSWATIPKNGEIAKFHILFSVPVLD